MTKLNNSSKNKSKVDDIVNCKINNTIRLEELEIDHILKKMGGSQVQKLSLKLFKQNLSEIYFKNIEFTIIEFYTDTHIEFVRNMRDIFFYFDLTYTGRIRRVI